MPGTHKSPHQICKSTRHFASAQTQATGAHFSLFVLRESINVQRLCKASVYLPICACVCVSKAPQMSSLPIPHPVLVVSVSLYALRLSLSRSLSLAACAARPRKKPCTHATLTCFRVDTIKFSFFSPDLPPHFFLSLLRIPFAGISLVFRSPPRPGCFPSTTLCLGLSYAELTSDPFAAAPSCTKAVVHPAFTPRYYSTKASHWWERLVSCRPG